MRIKGDEASEGIPRVILTRAAREWKKRKDAERERMRSAVPTVRSIHTAVMAPPATVAAVPKTETYRNPEMGELLRQLPCSNCGAEDGTVVGAHRNEGKGMGTKTSDALQAALCFRCHMFLDQGGGGMTREGRREFWNAAYIKTMQALIERGLLRIAK
jgi:hypothetical protein